MKAYVADFETITSEPTRIWAWGAVDIESATKFVYGNSIDTFFEWCYNKRKVYFHNLKFDGPFIIDALYRRGFKYSTDEKFNCFSTLISQANIWYSITVYFGEYKVVFYDSLKKLRGSASSIAKSFNLDEQKLSIDYNEYRKIGHELTQEEIDYLRNDCVIIAKALNEQIKQGLTKMTIGSDAMNFFKETVEFDKLFPILDREIDKRIRKAYRGGVAQVNPIYAGKKLDGVDVYDLNSAYAYVMKYKPMPYGSPAYFEGEYKYDPDYPLYIIKFKAMFHVKQNHIPTIQLKGSSQFRYSPTEYIRDSIDLEDLTLTSVDFEIFKDHYEIQEIYYEWGYKFKATTGIFDQHIDKWYEVKQNSTGALRAIAKEMLTALYGKFAKNEDVTQRIPMFDEEQNKIVMKKGAEKVDKTVYLPVGAFITAYSRDLLIRSAQDNYDNFIYCDTDSIHIYNPDSNHKVNIEVDDKKLGAWKHEGHFWYSVYLRPKCYIHIEKWHIHTTCAGMPDGVKKKVRIRNFKVGAVYEGKLVGRIVEGGTVLKETTFKILE